MPGRGNVRFLYTYRTPEIIATARATSPPFKGSDGGLTIVIPVPSITRNGDNMLAVTQHLPGRTLTPPSGWSLVGGDTPQAFNVWKRTALSEPASYSWLQSGTVQARSGCIIVVRGGTIGSLAVTVADPTDTITVPDRTAGALEGALWLSFFSADDPQNDAASTAGGFTLSVIHSGNGPMAYHIARVTAIGHIANLAANQTITGKTWSEPLALARNTAALIINP